MFLSINADYELEISPEALALKPVRAILDKNGEDNMDLSIQELSYIFYMEDVKSLFQYMPEGIRRKKEVLDVITLPDDWVESQEVKECRKFYRELQSHNPIVDLFRTARKSFNNFKKFLEDIDYNERDTQSRKLIHNPAQMATVFKQLRAISKELQDAEADVLLGKTSLENKVGSTEKGLLEEDYAV